MKKIKLITLSALLIFTLSVSAFATSDGAIFIEADLRPDYTITIDGEEQTFKDANEKTVYPIAYEGTTYLPIRAIAEFMGKDVAWDGENNLITITSKDGETLGDAEGKDETVEVEEVIEEQQSLYSRGLEAIGTMNTLANSNDFIILMTLSDEIKSIVSSIGNVDYENPKAVYSIKNIEGIYMSTLSAEVKANLSPAVEEIIEQRMVSAVAGQLNARTSTETLAAASVLTVSDAFVYEGIQGAETYLYLYEGGNGALVSFVPGDENIVASTATPIIADVISTLDTAAAVEQFFGNSISVISVETEETTEVE